MSPFQSELGGAAAHGRVQAAIVKVRGRSLRAVHSRWRKLLFVEVITVIGAPACPRRGPVASAGTTSRARCTPVHDRSSARNPRKPSTQVRCNTGRCTVSCNRGRLAAHVLTHQHMFRWRWKRRQNGNRTVTAALPADDKISVKTSAC